MYRRLVSSSEQDIVDLANLFRSMDNPGSSNEFLDTNGVFDQEDRSYFKQVLRNMDRREFQ